ncbi:GNAT family N-acetyltransferase [Jeotgalibaca caeni]|uniref:GNAT family N-acetyltransferase n=1 Tax=Jeotgalibaca caeni TaxID=3028623 RepID=UPI00237E228F|nr:GNAT family N-acetyltransferase [Jeotgalibaca caeni]MDE1548508.1 GNAT family N-acetyltransferase [Jeotgalibaca caeni]
MTVYDFQIRPIRENDFPYVLAWSQDEAFCLANGWEVNRNEQELYNWWLHCVNHQSEKLLREGVEFEGRLIGYVDVADCTDMAEVGIAIGDRTLWGQGMGTHILQRQMNHTAKVFGITVFYAETHETNIRSRRMLEKVGFEEVSRVGMEAYLGTEVPLIQYRFNKEVTK